MRLQRLIKTEVEADLQLADFEAGEWLHEDASDGEVAEALSFAERRLTGPAQLISERK